MRAIPPVESSLYKNVHARWWSFRKCDSPWVAPIFLDLHRKRGSISFLL